MRILAGWLLALGSVCTSAADLGLFIREQLRPDPQLFTPGGRRLSAPSVAVPARLPGPKTEGRRMSTQAGFGEILADAGLFDEKFRWYRSADIEWSFRVKEAGYACAVVDVSVTKHEHRAWAAATEEERASRSKRNFNSGQT